MCSHTYNRKVI